MSPDGPNRNDLLHAAIMARGRASDVLLQRFADRQKPLTKWEKSPGALVTDADITSDDAIAEALRACNAGGKIISEETPSTLSSDSPVEWLVDPLCGTVPFSTGMTHWGVNIAARIGNALVASSFATPMSGDAIDTVQDATPMHDGGPLTSTSPHRNLAESTIGLEIDGKDVWERLATNGELRWLSKVGQAMSFASAAYPIMQVCLGRMAGVVFYRIEPMHIAAGALAATNLGIKVTDGLGRQIDWSSNAEVPIFVLAWDAVHSELIDAIANCR